MSAIRLNQALFNAIFSYIAVNVNHHYLLRSAVKHQYYVLNLFNGIIYDEFASSIAFTAY